jgi:spore germination protein
MTRAHIAWGIACLFVAGFLLFGVSVRDENMEMLSSVIVARNNQATSTATSSVPVPASPVAHDKIIFGSIPYWDQDRAVADFKQHADTYDIISMFWYRLDPDGGIVKYRYAKEDPSLLAFARARGVKTLALIANLPENGDWDPDRVEAAIGSPEARAAHIAAIRALAEEKGFDGINVDYEFLRDSQTEDFSAFIRDLAAGLHADGRILAVAIHAQYAGGPTRGQDLRALQAADILAFMTYDEHWETSGPGPVASLPWVREVLTYALSLGLDPKKIYMGLPLYGYDWPQGGTAEGREYEDVVRIANLDGSEVRFDAFAASPVVTYRDGGEQRELWFENVESFTAKYRLADEYDLGGVHLWRLGREDMRIYEVLGE